MAIHSPPSDRPSLYCFCFATQSIAQASAVSPLWPGFVAWWSWWEWYHLRYHESFLVLPHFLASKSDKNIMKIYLKRMEIYIKQLFRGREPYQKKICDRKVIIVLDSWCLLLDPWCIYLNSIHLNRRNVMWVPTRGSWACVLSNWGFHEKIWE